MSLRIKLTACAVFFFVTSSVAHGQQDFPTKPLRVLTSEAGGGNDYAARLIAPSLATALGQPAVIENRGGNVIILAETLAKAPADGHTLLVYANGIWISPLLQKVPYDMTRDFAPVTLAAASPTILVVHPSLPVRSVQDLLKLARAHPGELNYASTGPGGTTHLSGELFKSLGRVNITRIPYKGTGPALAELMGGQVQLMFATGIVVPHVKSGKLRALAVTSAQPSELLPDLPTVAASGLPGYESETIYGVFVPAKTPEPVIRRLNQEIVRILQRPDTKEKFFNAGVSVRATSPERAAETIKTDMTRWAKVIKEGDITQN